MKKIIQLGAVLSILCLVNVGCSSHKAAVRQDVRTSVRTEDRMERRRDAISDHYDDDPKLFDR